MSTVDELAEALRAGGGRMTLARRQVLDVVTATSDHLTADEILERVQADAPEVHRATVYRNLDTLTRIGVIEHTHLGHGPAVYHLVTQRHHHLVCEACGLVIDIDTALFNELEARVHKEYGFHMDPGHFAVVGVCADCAEHDHSGRHAHG